MQYELAKVKIAVGPIVCQPSENALLIREQMVADHIEALNVSLFWGFGLKIQLLLKQFLYYQIRLQLKTLLMVIFMTMLPKLKLYS